MTALEPLSKLFSALFFASIGMVVSPVFLWANFALICGTIAQVCVRMLRWYLQRLP
jgi:CPA2 family monovalent cation:H+ antiporter-2